MFKKLGKKFTKAVDKNLYKLGKFIDTNVNDFGSRPYRQPPYQQEYHQQEYQPEPDYIRIEREFPRQGQYVYDLSKKLYEMIRKGEVKDSDDLFHFIEAYQTNPLYHQEFSEIYYYIWIGGLRCRYQLDEQCKRSIKNFNKVYEKYNTFFSPFIGYFSDPSKQFLSKENQLKGKQFAITLSQTLPSTFVVYYYDPNDRKYKRDRIGPEGDVIQKIEEIRILSGEQVTKAKLTFDQLNRPTQAIQKPDPLNIKEKGSYRISKDTKLYENPPDQTKLEKEEINYIKEIMKEIFQNKKLVLDKKLTWIVRWIGVDCPFDNNQVCKDRFNVLIKLREEYEEVFNHLFDDYNEMINKAEFDPNYTYLFLSDEVPGKFKYIYYDEESAEVKSISSNYEELIKILNSDYTFIKYLDKCVPNKLTKEVNCEKRKRSTKSTKNRTPQKNPVDILYVFDFDMTLTYLITCNNQNINYTQQIIDPHVPINKENEIFYSIMGLTNDDAKKNIEIFKNFVNGEIEKGNKIAIATFGTKEIINKVMQKIFDGKSPLDPQKDIITEEDYGVKGCQKIPKNEQQRSSKLNYIEQIINKNNIEPKEIYLIDDSSNKIKTLDYKINGNPVKGIYIPVKSKDGDGGEPGFVNTLNIMKKYIPSLSVYNQNLL